VLFRSGTKAIRQTPDHASADAIVAAITITSSTPNTAASVRNSARTNRAAFRELAGIFAIVFGLVVAAMLASALAWSGVGLIAFVPLVGLAVFPLQLAALILRGIVFEYLGLTALGAYLSLYAGNSGRRVAAVTHSFSSSRITSPSPSAPA